MQTFTAVVERCPDTGLYVGYVPGFPGAHSQGETREELNGNLTEVVALLLDDGPPELVGVATGRSRRGPVPTGSAHMNRAGRAARERAIIERLNRSSARSRPPGSMRRNSSSCAAAALRLVSIGKLKSAVASASLRRNRPSVAIEFWMETRVPKSCRQSRQAERYKHFPQVGIEDGSASQIVKPEPPSKFVGGGRLPVFRPLGAESSCRISCRKLSCLVATVEPRQDTFEVRPEKDESQIRSAHGVRGVAAVPPIVLQPIGVKQDQRVREFSVPGRTLPVVDDGILHHPQPVTPVT